MFIKKNKISFPPVITIDGPSGVGKSSLSKKIANILNWKFLESGMMYRMLAVFLFNKNKEKILKNIINFKKKEIDKKFSFYFSKSNNLTYKLNNLSFHLENLSSKIAVFPNIRNYLLLKQRKMRTLPGLIADGRDMGTIVFPDALIKFFLYANIKTRAKRRLIELKKKGKNINLNNLLKKMQKRDDRDRNRKCSPLFPAKNAIIINVNKISLKKTIYRVMYYIKKML